MEDNSISQDQNYTCSNITFGYCGYSNLIHNYNINVSCDYQYLKNLNLSLYVLTWIIICISLLLTLVAIYFLYSEVRNDHVAPIYVINLLITDLIQLCNMIVWVAPHDGRMKYDITCYVYTFCAGASVGFMVCVALERYLVIACPLWYRFRRNIKFSVLVCVVVWVLPLFDLLSNWFWKDFKVRKNIRGSFLLLPFPLFVFFFGGTLKSLSTSRVPSDEKRRILGVLVLALLIYTLLFLPRIIVLLLPHTFNFTFEILSMVLLRSSPLADLVIYVFMRKGTKDKLLASVCCFRINMTDDSISTA